MFGFFPVKSSCGVVKIPFFLIVRIGSTENMTVAYLSEKCVAVSSTLACMIMEFFIWHIECHVRSNIEFILRCFGATSVSFIVSSKQNFLNVSLVNIDPKSAYIRCGIKIIVFSDIFINCVLICCTLSIISFTFTLNSPLIFGSLLKAFTTSK